VAPLSLPAAIEPYFFIQAPDKVVIISQVDHQSRHIYLTDRHSQNVKPSWSGESIGHYEGDELVVDTIGISARAPVDKFFTPYTEHFHMIERFRLASGGDRLEVRVHVEDPGAFTMAWNAEIPARRTGTRRKQRAAAESRFGSDERRSAHGIDLRGKPVLLLRK
jgi:hypothetical protein